MRWMRFVAIWPLVAALPILGPLPGFAAPAGPSWAPLEARKAAAPVAPAAGSAAILALRAVGADLAVDLGIGPGAPTNIEVALQSASGVALGAKTLFPASPGRATVLLPGALERFLTDGFDFWLRLRDGDGADLAPPAPFTVAMTCTDSLCRFLPELGVEAGGAIWLDDRLKAALQGSDPAEADLLAAAVAEDRSLLGAARDLAARLVGSVDGVCRCRWAFSTAPAICGGPGVYVGIYDRGVRQDGLSVHREWRGVASLEPFCWAARDAGSERIQIDLGGRKALVAWPRVALSLCGSCAGLAVQETAFRGGAIAKATGVSRVATRAGWSFSVEADATAVLSGSDVRAATSPLGEDVNESAFAWTGTASTVEWRLALDAALEAPDGIDRGTADSRVAYEIRATGEAACASPPSVEVGKTGGWWPPSGPIWEPVDPNQISVVIGECRPPM